MPFDATQYEDDEAFKAFILSITKEAVTTAVSGFETANGKLKDDLRKAKDKAGKAIDEDELAELRAAKEKLTLRETEEMENKGEYEKLMTTIRDQHKAELATMQTKLDTERNTTRKLLVDGGLSTALAEAGTNPALLQAAVKLLADDITVIEEDGINVARVGDKTITEYVKSWAEGDVGKNFILASDNSGGGNKPGAGGGGKPGEADQFFDPTNANFNRTEQFKVRQEDPTKFDQLTAKFAGVKAPNQGGGGIARIPGYQNIQQPSKI